MDKDTVAEAYIYLLGRALVVRQEHIDRRDPAFAYNRVKYNPLSSADFVNPNFDVAYLESWIAVDEDHPVILEVPEIKHRYYTAQILDEWGEVIANINERTFPSKPYGRFALCRPGSRPRAPEDAARIDLHSSKAKLLGRVEIKGDPNGAVVLQKQFRLTPQGLPFAPAPPELPNFPNDILIGAELFEYGESLLRSAFDVSPRAADMQQKVHAVAAHIGSSAAARMAVDRQIRDKVVPAFKEYVFTKSAAQHEGWIGGSSHVGNYNGDYWLRTAANYAGIWANTPDEVVYFTTNRDAEGERLDGGETYLIDFPPDRLPDKVVDGYWSMVLVDDINYRVVKNPLNRFNLSNRSPLKKNTDGSLTIALGPKQVAGVPETNWLPSPPGKPYSLTFRTYVPKAPVKHGQWAPPGVTHLH